MYVKLQLGSPEDTGYFVWKPCKYVFQCSYTDYRLIGMIPVATNWMWTLRKDWIIRSDANDCLIYLRNRLAILEKNPSCQADIMVPWLFNATS